jgi:hypothetical protein
MVRSLFLLALISVTTMAFTPNQATFDSIESLFKTNNLDGFAVLIHEEVVVCFQDDESVLNRLDALKEIKTYFKNYPQTSFVWKHKGKSKDGIYFAIGEYTSKSKKIACYFYLKSDANNKLLVREMRFEI